MPKKMRALPVEYVERAMDELKKSSLYENATLTEVSRIKVENLKADVLFIAPERDNEWPSPDAVRRMAKKLEEAS